MVDLGLNDNAAQVVALRPRVDEGAAAPPPPDIVLGNIHVLFNNKRGDTKLGQVSALSCPLSSACVFAGGLHGVSDMHIW